MSTLIGASVICYNVSTQNKKIKEKVENDIKASVALKENKEDRLREEFAKKKVSYKKCLFALPLLAISLIGCFTMVETGHTGVVTVFGNVQDTTLDAGLHTKLWWQDIVQMDNRNQKQTIQLNAFSNDIQKVEVVYSLNYQISSNNAKEIYKTIGVNYYDKVMKPRIEENVKSVIAEYTAETLISNRSRLFVDIYKKILLELKSYNIDVISANVEDIDFSDAFTSAVEEKQVASQNKQKAMIEQEQKTFEQEEQAKRDQIKAEAEAEIAKIKAEADKEVARIGSDSAEYQGRKDASIMLQKLISLNGYHLDETNTFILDNNNQPVSEEDLKVATQNLLLQEYLKSWDGKLPETYIGTNDFYELFKTIMAEKGNSSSNP